MGHRCCSKQKIKRGLWSPEEDEKLIKYINTNGHKSWSSVPKFAGLQRCGKSCRLRWINYLRPDLKRGSFTAEEEQIIIDIHRILGNRWAQIAKHLPGRTDNEVKNFWNSCIKKKLISQGLDPQTHTLLSSHKRNSSSACNKNSNSIFIMTSPNNAPLFETTPRTLSSLSKTPPNILQTPSTIVPSEMFPTPTPSILSTKFSELPHELLLENPTNICSPSYNNVNPNTFELPNNEKSAWVARVNNDNNAENFSSQRVEVQQEKDMKGVDVREAKSDKDNLEAEASFESSNFDFGLLESVLNSEFMSQDFNCVDQLAWNF